MTIPNSTYTELVTTTIADYRDTLADNVLEHNALLSRLKRKGNAEPVDGGTVILENLMYAENSTVSWYSGYEQLDVSASDVLTSASFDWKQLNCNVTFSGLEELKNAGRNRKHALVRSRIMVAEKTMQNEVSEALYNSNTETSGKEIGGLQHLVADDPTTGTIGGIDASSSDNTWWRNQLYDFSDESVTASSTTIQHAMNRQYLRTLRGRDKIDFIVAGETYFTYYEESLQTNQRFMSADEGKGGFTSYKYKNADVFFDPHCSSTRMYMLNTDYIHFRPHTDRNFVTLERKASVNQDATVVPLYWAGNMTVSNRSLQSIIVA